MFAFTRAVVVGQPIASLPAAVASSVLPRASSSTAVLGFARAFGAVSATPPVASSCPDVAHQLLLGSGRARPVCSALNAYSNVAVGGQRTCGLAGFGGRASFSTATTGDATDASVSTDAPAFAGFAVVEIGTHQYKVMEGDQLTVMRLPDVRVGARINLPRVMLVGTQEQTFIGTPYLGQDQFQVHAVVEEQTLADKLIVFKKKRRKGYQRTQGHRQGVTTLRIVSIMRVDVE